MPNDISGKAKAFEAAAAELRAALTEAETASAELVGESVQLQARLEMLEAMRDAAATAAEDARRRTEAESQRAERAEITAARLRQERNEAKILGNQLQAEIVRLNRQVEAGELETARQTRRAEQAEAAIEFERECRDAAEQRSSDADNRAAMALVRMEQVEGAMRAASSGSRLARVWQAFRGGSELAPDAARSSGE